MNFGVVYLANLSHYVPELLAIVTMMGLLFLEATYGDDEKGRHYVFWSAIAGIFSTAVFLVLQLGNKPVMIFTNAVVIDPFSTLAKLIMTLGTLGCFIIAKTSSDIYEKLKSEFYIMTTGVLVGGMLLSSANNLLIIYLGIETLSILSYVLAALKKDDDRSSEAGLKYVLYGGLSAGVMLYGISHVYGVLGTIQFNEIIPMMKGLNTEQIVILMPSFLLFFVGLGYKIACVPFHMWTPDVYEGSPIPVTAFFSIVPKVAAIACLIRVTLTFFSDPGVLQYSWVGLLSVVSALTMTVGNVSAIGQKSVKRMLAYSSISHAGMMLLGVIVIDEVGIRAILYYAIAYLFMTLVAFFVTSFVANKYGNDHFERFNGLIKRYPVMAIMMSITLFSLAGLPPFSGFVAKFNILAAIIAKKHYTLAVIAALNSVVSLFYYMKLSRLMILKEPDSTESIQSFSFVGQSVIVALAIPIVILGIFWGSIMSIAQKSMIFIQ